MLYYYSVILLCLYTLPTSSLRLGRHAKRATCSTNAECLKKRLPLLKPRNGLRRRQSNVCPSAVIRNDLPPCDGTFEFSGTIDGCVIPATGTYTISAAGGTGGATDPANGLRGGYGALAVGQGFNLLQGTQIYLAVGAAGGSPSSGNNAGGGAGGSFVYIQACSAAEPLILVVGGGGGGTSAGNAGPPSDGRDAPTTQDASYSGQDGWTRPNGGQNGLGGQASDPSDTTLMPGGGGAGYLGNGADGDQAQGGFAIAGNLLGGTGYLRETAGGFGGGGGASQADGGGGGGYSGGGGGLFDTQYGPRGGGGGSSYVATSYNGPSGATVSEGYSQWTSSSFGYVSFLQTA